MRVAAVCGTFRLSAGMHNNRFLICPAAFIKPVHIICVHVKTLHMGVQLQPGQPVIECFLQNRFGIVLAGKYGGYAGNLLVVFPAFSDMYRFNCFAIPGRWAYWSAMICLMPRNSKKSNICDVVIWYRICQAFSSNHLQMAEKMLPGKIWTWASTIAGRPAGTYTPSRSFIDGIFGFNTITPVSLDGWLWI